MTLHDYLSILVGRKGSDLHLKPGRPPLIRTLGELVPLDLPVVSEDDLDEMLISALSPFQRKKLDDERELDFSFQVEGLARFRGNIFFSLGQPGAVFRVIPTTKIKSLDDLGLPAILKQLIFRNQGILLITGPTGSGKSTTLAACIDLINESVHKHIITIEDPIEFVHSDNKCTINQREIGSDTLSFAEALRRALRQDPDIILVGEMRDGETIQTAMTAAETGHLVLSTLHTNDAKQSIDRIIDSFSPQRQHQVRMQLALTLAATISQRLVRKSDGTGMVPIVEVMINTPTIRKLIEEGRTGQIDKVIADSVDPFGMQTLNQHLHQLIRDGVLSPEDALAASNNPNDLRIIIQTQSLGRKPDKPTETKTSPPWKK